MRNSERVIAALKAHPTGLCDDCLSKFSGVTPRQSARAIALALTRDGLVLREQRVCPEGCSSRWKYVTALKQISPGPSAPKAPSLDAQIAWFSHRLSELNQYLSEIDPEGTKKLVKPIWESVPARVNRLKELGTLSPNVAGMILTFNGFRVRVVKKLLALNGPTWQAASTIWAALEHAFRTAEL